MFSWVGKVTESVTSGIGKIFGNKEKREQYKAELDERSDARLMKELDYRQSKLSPALYSAMVIPFALMWLSFGFYPILIELPIPVINRIGAGYLELLDAFGMNNLTLIILQFLGLSGVAAAGAFKGVKVNNLAKALQKKSELDRKKQEQEERDRSLQVDLQMLMRWEGNTNKGYVPPDKDNDNSGVTIGMGVDLGHQSMEKLKRTMLSESVLSELSPYLGVTGAKARDLIQKIPLTLSDADTTHLNHAVLKIYAREVRTHFKGTLWTYPTEAQTVILSRAWHGGSNLPKAAPKFFKAAIARNWKGMEEELRQFYAKRNGVMPYAKRLNEEADLIAKIVEVEKVAA